MRAHCTCTRSDNYAFVPVPNSSQGTDWYDMEVCVTLKQNAFPDHHWSITKSVRHCKLSHVLSEHLLKHTFLCPILEELDYLCNLTGLHASSSDKDAGRTQNWSSFLYNHSLWIVSQKQGFTLHCTHYQLHLDRNRRNWFAITCALLNGQIDIPDAELTWFYTMMIVPLFFELLMIALPIQRFQHFYIVIKQWQILFLFTYSLIFLFSFTLNFLFFQ